MPAPSACSAFVYSIHRLLFQLYPATKMATATISVTHTISSALFICFVFSCIFSNASLLVC